MDAGQIQARATEAEVTQQIENLKLHPRQRRLLEAVLHDYPALTVQEALEMLRAGGM